MAITIDDIRGLRAHDPRGLNRTISWSLAVHVTGIVLLVLAPRLGWIKPRQAEKLIVIDLGGVPDAKPGPTNIGGRPIDQAVPEPKRPEIVKPVATKPDVMTIPTKAAPPKKMEVPRKQEQPKAPSPTTQPPSTGRQVTPGSTRADTGVSGMQSGLSIGQGANNMTSLSDFCCKAYLDDVETRIKSRTNFAQQERGTVQVQFTIQRNGTVTDVKLAKNASYLLDSASMRSFVGLTLPPLPAEYTSSTLNLRLSFEYK